MSTDTMFPRPRILVSCVGEDRPEFHRRIEGLIGSIRCFGGALADSPIVVNMVDRADPDFVRRVAANNIHVDVVPRSNAFGAHANKLAMLGLATSEEFDLLLALDCDVAMARDPLHLVRPDRICVVAADLDPLTDAQWRRLGDALDVEMPARTEQTGITGAPMYPYFNSGVLSVPRALCADLRREWIRALAELEAIFRERPSMLPRKAHFFVDQLALAMALWRGLPWSASSCELNFPTHVSVARAGADTAPAILHYHAHTDRNGLLLRPLCFSAASATDRVNRARAAALGIPYRGLRDAPPGVVATRRLRSGVAGVAGDLRVRMADAQGRRG